MSVVKSVGEYSFLDFSYSIDFSRGEERDHSAYDETVRCELLNAVIVHEKTHQIQNISTSYGLWKSKILFQSALLSSCAIEKNPNVKLNVPFFDYIPRVDDCFSLSSKRIKEHKIFQYPKIIFDSVGLVDGPNTTSKEIWELAFKNILFPVQTASPKTIYLQSKIKTTFGTKQLIEGHARLQEIKYLWDYSGLPFETLEKLHQKLVQSSDYTSFLSIVDYSLGGGKNVISNDCLKKFSLTLAIVMTDIALNPYIPSFHMKEKKVKWEDVNPSWRFLKLQEIVIKNNLKDNILEIDELYELFLFETGWMNPSSAIDRQLDHIFDNEVNHFFPMEIIGELNDLRKIEVSPLMSWFYFDLNGFDGVESSVDLSKSPLNIFSKKMIESMIGDHDI